MLVDYGYDWSGLVLIYAVMFLIAFLWWWFNTDSECKLLEVFSSLSIIGLILAVAGAVAVVMDLLGHFTVGEASLIVGVVISAVAGTGWLLLAKREGAGE